MKKNKKKTPADSFWEKVSEQMLPADLVTSDVTSPEKQTIATQISSSLQQLDTTQQSAISYEIGEEYIDGTLTSVRRNVPILEIKGQKIGDKSFFHLCDIHELLVSRKRTAEATQKEFEQMKEKQGLKKIQKRHRKRETNPALSHDLKPRGMTISDICKRMKLSPRYVVPLVKIMHENGNCDTFQLEDRDNILDIMNKSKNQLENIKKPSKKEKVALNKLKRKIPKTEKSCSPYVMANKKTEDYLDLVQATPGVEPIDISKYKTSPLAVLNEIRLTLGQ